MSLPSCSCTPTHGSEVIISAECPAHKHLVWKNIDDIPESIRKSFNERMGRFLEIIDEIPNIEKNAEEFNTERTKREESPNKTVLLRKKRKDNKYKDTM